MTEIRLGWDTRADELQLEIDVLAIGIAALLVAALVDFSGAGIVVKVLLYLVGGLFTLVGLVRAHGWRTLLAPRTLTTGPEILADNAMANRGFRHSWSTLRAVCVLVEEDAPRHYGTTLVIFPADGDVEVRHVPRRPGIAEAVRDGAPSTWQRTTGPWASLVTAPGTDPQTLAVPATQDKDAVVVNIGRTTAWHGLVGGGLAALFGALAVVGAANGAATNGASNLVVALVGLPFCLIGLATAGSVLVLVRPRSIVLDRHGFTWDDPRVSSFVVAWRDLASLTVETATVHNPNSGDVHSVHVVLVPKDPRLLKQQPGLAKFAHEGRVVLPLADQPASAATIDQAAHAFAPDVRQESTERLRRFGVS
ncbi:MAG TPA: hypothetical protein VGN81_15035 [Pseudonocardiaceae bacterium]|jgi:hypothetical protein